MKTILKLLLAFILFTAYKGTAQTETPDKYPETVTIKIIEGNGGGLNNVDSRMVIVGPDNHVTIKELKRLNYLIDGNEGVEFNTKALQLELQVWHNKGFQVKSMSSVAPRDYVVITIIILQKN